MFFWEDNQDSEAHIILPDNGVNINLGGAISYDNKMRLDLYKLCPRARQFSKAFSLAGCRMATHEVNQWVRTGIYISNNPTDRFQLGTQDQWSFSSTWRRYSKLVSNKKESDAKIIVMEWVSAIMNTNHSLSHSQTQATTKEGSGQPTVLMFVKIPVANW